MTEYLIAWLTVGFVVWANRIREKINNEEAIYLKDLLMGIPTTAMGILSLVALVIVKLRIDEIDFNWRRR